MSENNLYFIAIVPPDELREEVKKLKLEMSARFNAKHALKSPAHITLKMPFRYPSSEEKNLLAKIQRFAEAESPFTAQLNGFDCFEPRVIYVKIDNHEPIYNLHTRITLFLIKYLHFHPNFLKGRFHAHMTIATRDLTPSAFDKSWNEFKARKFKATFTVKSICLLKHNGKQWEIYREFPFNRVSN